MNSVQLRFQSGAENCSRLEKFADALLAFPKAMWGDKSITHINHGRFEVKDSFSFKSWLGDRASYPGESLAVLAYVVGSIIAAPLLALGLLFKELALRNETAQKYHSKIGEAASLMIEEKSVEKQLSECSREINKLETIRGKYRDHTQEYKKAIESLPSFLIWENVLNTRKKGIEKSINEVGESLNEIEKSFI